jgi:hypothetical protein
LSTPGFSTAAGEPWLKTVCVVYVALAPWPKLKASASVTVTS